MEAVFTRKDAVARLIVDWLPCLVRLVWKERKWHIAVRFRSLSMTVARSWSMTCQGHLKIRRQRIVSGSSLGNVHTAEIFFESDLMNIGSQSLEEDILEEDIAGLFSRDEREFVCCLVNLQLKRDELSRSIRRLFSRDEHEFVHCLQNLKDLTCATQKLRVLRVTIPFLCKTINLLKVAKWIVGIHSHLKKSLNVVIHIPVGLCVMIVRPSGDFRLGRSEGVHPDVIRVLIFLLNQGVHVKSLTYFRHRWVLNHALSVQRKAADLPIVEETDFVETNDVKFALGLYPMS